MSKVEVAIGQSSTLVDLALVNIRELFHSPQKEAFVLWSSSEGHEKAMKVGSRDFRLTIVNMYFDITKKVPGSSAVADALAVLSAKALLAGRLRQTSLRSAAEENSIFYDLADRSHKAVKITSEGWTICTQTPCVFLRPNGMQPLPAPIPQASLKDFRLLLNIDDDHTWCLLLAWITAAMRPSGPYPALIFTGEPGAGKSLTALLISKLIDPHGAELRNEPRSEQDLAIAAANSKVLAFDNISKLPPWLSDAFCRFSSGGSHASRQLYSDGDEFLLKGQTPLILTGIEDIATRSDLVDRAITIELSRISSATRQTESAILTQFETSSGLFLGALFDLVSGALRHLPQIRLVHTPRLADFAYWGTALERAAKWPEGFFLEAFLSNQRAAGANAIENSVVARLVLRFIQQRKEWTGTHTALMRELRILDAEDIIRDSSWPRTVPEFSASLRRMAVLLRQVGVIYRYGFRRKNNARLLSLSFDGIAPVTNVTSVTSDRNRSKIVGVSLPIEYAR